MKAKMGTQPKTIKIDVSLNLASKPNVVLKTSAGSSARNVESNNGDTIEWKRKDPNNQFDMNDLQPSGEGKPFQLKTISGDKLSCLYQPTSCDANAEFTYTLTVKKGNTTYNTDDPPSPNPDDDKPVIRN